MQLRQYQTDFVQAVAKGFHEGFRRQLGVLPTAGGKTIVAAEIARRFHEKRNEKTLFLAHREELITQAADKIEKMTGLVPSVEKANRHASRDSAVVVGSIQTVQRSRLESWPKDHFGLIICDEAHHCISDQWQATLSHFDARVLGITATPDRADKKLLSSFFENLAFEIGILELISQGWLSPVQVQAVPLRIDLNAVKRVAGDYDATGLDAAITPYLGEIARHLDETCGSRKKIVAFLPLIATSQRFVEECRKVGIDARHVDGASPDRKEILRDFHEGKFRLLSNAMLLTEGYDEPGIDCVIPLRPTRSRGLFCQIVGRGTRIADGKKNCLLLDFLWLHEKHDLAKPASLVARTKEEEDSITTAIGEGRDLGEAAEDASAEREAALIRAIAENARRKERFIPIEQVGALLKDEKIKNYAPVFGWELAPATPGQVKVLERFGLKCTTKGEASMVMNRLFDRSKAKLATVRQLMWLVRMKHPAPETATQAEAKAFLDEKWNTTKRK